MPTLAKIPATMQSEYFYSRLRMVEWNSPPFFDVMPMGRMVAMLLEAAEICELRFVPKDRGLYKVELLSILAGLKKRR